MDQTLPLEKPRHAEEVASGRRFEFGKNWARFLAAHRIEHLGQADESLKTMLGLQSLAGKTFLDIGSGSGLFSLAARRLGARVRSFDYDPHSVACAGELKRRYAEGDEGWVIEEGSVLDREYLARLGRFDIVYSWGVLHHTGDMWTALANVVPLVKEGGTLFISIYNDQGAASRRWEAIKRLYNRLPRGLRFLVLVPALLQLWWTRWLKDLLRGRPLKSWRTYQRNRGMSPWPDCVDWVGGYPFEVAKPEQIFRFYRDRGFTLREMTTQGGDLGCNEYLFARSGAEPPLSGAATLAGSSGAAAGVRVGGQENPASES